MADKQGYDQAANQFVRHLNQDMEKNFKLIEQLESTKKLDAAPTTPDPQVPNDRRFAKLKKKFSMRKGSREAHDLQQKV